MSSCDLAFDELGNAELFMGNIIYTRLYKCFAAQRAAGRELLCIWEVVSLLIF
jgi:hypothetical protein